MKNFLSWIAAVVFVALMFSAAPSPAQALNVREAGAYTVNPEDVYYTPSGDILRADTSPVSVAALTQLPAELRDVGSRVDFTDIVVAFFLGLVAVVAALLRSAFKFLPDQIEGIFLAMRFDHLLQNGFENWAQKKAVEIRTSGVTIDLKNDAIASMVRYGKSFAGKMVEKNGGTTALEERAISRVDRYIDELLARWSRQKDNIKAVAAPVNIPPAPTERAPAPPAFEPG